MYKQITILAAFAMCWGTTAAFAQDSYNISVAVAENCTVTVSPQQESYNENEEISVSISPDDGATFDSFELYYECTEAEYWKAHSSNARQREGSDAPRRASAFNYRLESFYFNSDYDDEYEEVDKGKTYTFTMPARNVEIEVYYIASGTTNNVTVSQQANGSTNVDKTSAAIGETVTITATPAANYRVDEVNVWEVEGAFKSIIDFTTIDATHFSFTMPNNPVEVKVSYCSSDTPLPTVILEDNASNLEAIQGNNNKTVNVTLSGRTLYKDGSWNTLCLPFSLTAEQIAASELDGADIRSLNEASFENNTLTLNFSETGAVTEIETGKPYIIKWDGDGSENIVEPTFNNVIIQNVNNDVTKDLGNGMSITFKGTYNPVSFGEGGDNTVLYLGANNTLYYPSGAMTINAQRAYFQLTGLTAGEKADGIRSFVLNFGDESSTLGVTTPLSSRSGGEASWYTLDGRRLSGKPATKGLYINNGKKVIIR